MLLKLKTLQNFQNSILFQLRRFDTGHLIQLLMLAPTIEDRVMRDRLLERLLVFKDAIWMQADIQDLATCVETGDRFLVRVIALLSRFDELAGEDNDKLVYLIRHRRPPNDHYIPELLLRLQLRGLLQADLLLFDHLPVFSSNRRVLQVLFTAIAVGTPHANIRSMRLFLRARGARLKALARILVALSDCDLSPEGGLANEFHNIRKLSPRTRRKLIGDIRWLATRRTKDIARLYLNLAVAAGDTYGCDLLLPLLVGQLSQDVRLLHDLFMSGRPEVTAAACMVLRAFGRASSRI